jgi:hypothetical protein
MLLLRGCPLGHESHVIEMALIVLSDKLEVVNGIVVSSDQRVFARHHSELLLSDLQSGWLLRSISTMTLINLKTRARKSLYVPTPVGLQLAPLPPSPTISIVSIPQISPPSISRSPPAEPVQCILTDEEIGPLFKRVVGLSVVWNAPQQGAMSAERKQELGDAVLAVTKHYSVTVSSFIRHRRARPSQMEPTQSIGELSPSPTDRPKKRRRVKSVVQQKPVLAEEVERSDSRRRVLPKSDRDPIDQHVKTDEDADDGETTEDSQATLLDGDSWASGSQSDGDSFLKIPGTMKL